LEPELPSRVIEATMDLLSRNMAKACCNWGRIWTFASALAKSGEAPQSACDMTTGGRRGSGMETVGEKGVDERTRKGASADVLRFPGHATKTVAFDRHELSEILNLYGRFVAAGEWKDYAMDFTPDRATFSVFHRAAEQPLYRIVKDPALARKQGQYSVIAQGGLILKRGHELAQVLSVLLKKPRLAGA
jgi:Protein of unknown function (DUF2794)